MNEAIELINGIHDGDHITVTVPVGENSIEASGTTTVNADGTVTVVLDTPQSVSVPVIGNVGVDQLTIDRSGTGGNGQLVPGDTLTINANTDSVLGNVPVTINTGTGKGSVAGVDFNASDGTFWASLENVNEVPEALNQLRGKMTDQQLEALNQLRGGLTEQQLETLNQLREGLTEQQLEALNQLREGLTEQQLETLMQSPEGLTEQQLEALNQLKGKIEKDEYFLNLSNVENNAELGNRPYYSKEDDYKNLRKGENIKIRQSDYGTVDRENIHDKNMWHTHITETMGEYKPGEQVALADNPYLDKIISDNKLGGRQIFSDKDKTQFSKFDFVAQYAATGAYSVEDLLKTADALQDANLTHFSAHSHEDYWPPMFDKMLNDTKSADYANLANQLQDDVQQLEQDFLKTHDQMVEWAGSASEGVKEAINCILGKFECTMGNIKSVLSPACKRIEEFKKNLEDLKKGKEELDVLDEEFKTLEEDYNEKLQDYETYSSKPPEQYRSVPEYDSDGNITSYHQEVTSEYITWQQECVKKKAAVDEAKELMDKKQEEIDKKCETLDKLLVEILKTYFLIKNLVTTITSFKQYFKAGTQQASWISSPDNIFKYHDFIVDEFEDFTKMPVITSLSGYYDEAGEFHDYKIGDMIIHDDAHGYVYKITQPFDPLTGTIKIACFDETGKQIGDELTVWDPREIVPIEWVHEYDPEIYDPYLEPTPTRKPVRTPTPSPTPTRTPSWDPPPVTPSPTPTPIAPTPSPTPSPTPAWDPPPVTPSPTPTPIAPTPSPTPSPTPAWDPPPVTPTPFIPPFKQPTPPPFAPHTGLDSIYSSNPNDASESGLGLGALAALLAGATGLGATELLDRKKKKEEEDGEGKEDNQNN